MVRQGRLPRRYGLGIRKGTKLSPSEFHQFPYCGGHKTPASTVNNLLRILALIPGPQGDALRTAQAELATRSIFSDHDLQAAMLQRRDEIGVEVQEMGMSGIISSADAKQKRRSNNLSATSWNTPPNSSQRLVQYFTQGRHRSSP